MKKVQEKENIKPTRKYKGEKKVFRGNQSRDSYEKKGESERSDEKNEILRRAQKGGCESHTRE
jgi:hypothetical protein